MATIDIKTVGNLLIVSVMGELTADEIIAVVNKCYPGGIVKDVIWDLTNGSLQLISHQGFKEIAKAAKTAVAGGSRKGGKTAYVGDSDIEYDLLRMYKAIAETEGVPTKYDVFKTIEEVKDWIE